MAGPIELTLNKQRFMLCPRDDKTDLTQPEIIATQNALRQAQTDINATLVVLGKALLLLGSKEFGKVESPKFAEGADKAQVFYDILRAAFRLEPAHDKYGYEDIRRLLHHVQPMLKLLLDGLSKDNLVLADMESQVYAKFGKNAIGGYVDPPWYQKAAIRWASNYRNFWEEGEVHGPIHLNLTKLVNDHATLTRTLVHEATHKFGRTNDIAYYNENAAPRLMENIQRFRTMPLRPDPNEDMSVRRKRMVDKCIADAGSDSTGTSPDAMKPTDALNNADSHAYFVHWTAANPTMFD